MDHLMPLGEKNCEDEEEGAKTEDDGGSDEEELGKAGDTPPLPLHWHLLARLVLGVEWAVVRDLTMGLRAGLPGPVGHLAATGVAGCLARLQASAGVEESGLSERAGGSGASRDLGPVRGEGIQPARQRSHVRMCVPGEILSIPNNLSEQSKDPVPAGVEGYQAGSPVQRCEERGDEKDGSKEREPEAEDNVLSLPSHHVHPVADPSQQVHCKPGALWTDGFKIFGQHYELWLSSYC